MNNSFVKKKDSDYMNIKNKALKDAKQDLLKSSYTSSKRATEILFIAIFVVLMSWSSLNMVRSFTMAALPYFILSFVAAMFFSDFASGVAHWGADTWGDLDVPFVGQSFIRSFREHHLAPSAMCEHDVIETNGDNCMLTLPVLYFMAVRGVIDVQEDAFYLFTTSFWIINCFLIAWTNQYHKWSHTANPPEFVKILQQTGLILGKRHHGKHHQPPFDTNYCITNGWMNPILNFIGFWRAAESIISKATGWEPRADDYKWTGLTNEAPDVVKRYLEEKKDQ
eukprot:TRINITY_DN9800_c0_g1_i1.p1 TRINITY_DN9800_c0_g1~~TRINITY_DN9800_c0_g1_i1.p1  ORF type:complete len:280 (+),score=52.46 TRINITY_DN9800_c0_g1_i1:39-878(+)